MIYNVKIEKTISYNEVAVVAETAEEAIEKAKEMARVDKTSINVVSETDKDIDFTVFTDMTAIKDSMELDSGTDICCLKKNGREAYIKVQGFVTVTFKGQKYRHASEMPAELIEMFRDGSAYRSSEVFIEENNWYELFYGEDETHMPDSTIVEIDGYNVQQLLELCLECL